MKKNILKKTSSQARPIKKIEWPSTEALNPIAWTKLKYIHTHPYVATVVINGESCVQTYGLLVLLAMQWQEKFSPISSRVHFSSILFQRIANSNCNDFFKEKEVRIETKQLKYFPIFLLGNQSKYNFKYGLKSRE